MAAVLVAAFSLPVQAQEQCADRDRMVAHYESNWGEKPSGMGLLANGALFEVLVNPISKTFTVLVTSVSKRSCVMSAGKYWEQILEGHDDEAPDS